MGLIFYIGFMASGKSTLGEAEAARNGMRFVDLDQELWAFSGMPSWQYIKEKGEEAFRMAERDCLHRIVERWHQDGTPPQIVACGGGTPCFFDNMEFIKTSGHVVFIDTPCPRSWKGYRLIPNDGPWPGTATLKFFTSPEKNGMNRHMNG